MIRKSLFVNLKSTLGFTLITPRFARSVNVQPKGFTLIELLVVVSILALMTTLGIRVYRNQLENSIDQKKVRDLETIKQTLELFKKQNRSYPGAMSEIVPKLIETLPADSSSGYRYQYNAFPTGCTSVNRDCLNYVICAKREGTNVYDYPTGCGVLQCGPSSTDCDMGVSSPEYTGEYFIPPTPTP